MRRMKLCLWITGLVAALVALPREAGAQTTPGTAAPARTAPAGTAAAPATTPRVPTFVAATNLPSTGNNEMVAEIRYQNISLAELIGVLAEQAGVRFQADPEVFDTLAKDVNFTATNVTPAQALDQALSENRLVLIHDSFTGALMASTRDSRLSQAVAAAGPTTSTGPSDLGAGNETGFKQLTESGGEVPVLQAMQMMARLSNISIQFDPALRTGTRRIVGTNYVDVPGIATNTVDLADFRDVVSPEQALEAMLENYNLVMTPNPRTRVNTVTFRDPGAKEPMFTYVLQLKYSNPTNVMTIIQSTLSDPRSRAMPNPRTGQLVMFTTGKEQAMITNLIEQMDIPTKQVLIEARLVETARNPSTIKGIDWSPTLAGQNIRFGNGNTIGETVTTIPGTATGGQTPSGRPTGAAAPPYSASTILSTTVGDARPGLSLDTARGFYPNTAFLNADGVSAVLSFINTDNESDLMASPRAVMLDNQTAVLSVTRAFPVFEITPGSANSPAGATVTYTNLGTILTVTPKITADSNVTLRVIPEVSDIVAKDRQTINGLVNEANVYAIRKIETEVSIPSGHTLVMGGLTRDSGTRDFTKVPLLGDLPGIGRAFRRDSKNRQKLNLIIFITPTIIARGDFHETGTDFLQQVPVEAPDSEVSAWDSGKPKDWRSKKNKTP